MYILIPTHLNRWIPSHDFKCLYCDTEPSADTHPSPCCRRLPQDLTQAARVPLLQLRGSRLFLPAWPPLTSLTLFPSCRWPRLGPGASSPSPPPHLQRMWSRVTQPTFMASSRSPVTRRQRNNGWKLENSAQWLSHGCESLDRGTILSLHEMSHH